MLGKYKMRVNNEAESKEAQELFKWLGYLVVNHIDREKGFIVVSKEAKSPLNFDYFCSVENEITLSQLRDLVAQSKNEKGLISWADALRALADGKEVEYLYGDKWFSVVGEQVLITSITKNKFKFRLKPRTIKIELEIPAPFEPKNNKSAWVLDSATPLGYKSIIHHVGCVHSACWGTEDEIKQVVAALRSALTSK